MITRVAKRFGQLKGLERMIIVARREYWELCQRLVSGTVPAPFLFAAAGAERQDSVAAGIAMVDPGCDVVVVHDAVRPFVTPGLIERCTEVAARRGAALAALPASDTVKEVSPPAQVRRTLERAHIWLAQTPQAFRTDLLKQAYARAAAEGVRATDDAALVELLGATVTVVEGEVSNIKITTPHDLALAERIAELPAMS